MRHARLPKRLASAVAAGAVALPAAGAWLPARADGAPTVSLHAAFSPERLGRTATVSMDVRIDPGGERAGEIVPPPLTAVSLRYPSGLDVTLSGLGVDTCSIATLELAGVKACPADSWMGEGQAVAELPIHHQPFSEEAQVAIFRGPEEDNHLTMLFYVYGETAVSADLILTGRLLAADGPFGGRLQIAVPLVQSLPEAPDLAVGELKFVLGPPGYTYYERVRGELIPYAPQRIRLPERCPRGGFPFAIDLNFLGGQRASAKTAVPCPQRRP